MSRQPSVAPGALVSLCLVFGLAAVTEAQTVTSIAAIPSPACVNQPVTVIVSGTGTCSSIELSYDAPNGPISVLTDVMMPLVLTTTYSQVGTYTLRVVTAGGNCTGQVETTLEVNECGGGLTSVLQGKLGAIIAKLKPQVSGGWGIVQPGNPFPILVVGERFGAAKPRVFLEGEFSQEYPLAILELDVVDWSPSGKWLSASIPPAITGAVDHTAHLWVQTASGFTSNKWPVGFTAEREVKSLPESDVAVVSCGDDGNMDCCNHQPDDAGFFDPPTYCQFAVPPVGSFSGYHSNNWGAIGDDSGRDTFKVQLANGWVIDGYSYSSHYESGEGGVSMVSGSTPYGESTWQPKIDWWVSPGDNVSYEGTVFISGPKGTSHK